MSRSGLLVLVGLAGLALATPAPVVAQDDRGAVVQVIRGMFDALARGDTAGMRAHFHPEARVIQTGTREGAPFHRINAIDGFLQSIGGAVAAGRKLEERIFDPAVQVEDNFAQVWSRYEFYVDGQMSHCGVDGYQLFRTTQGWTLIQIVDTQRRPCNR